MVHPILGLHHVTATVDDAQADLDFCLNVLGMRLVKKTVNFDNHGVYHFYYGTERGVPGTIWTTFPYKGKGVRVGQKGAGQVVTTSFSVPAASLAFWQRRLREQGVEARESAGRFGEDSLRSPIPRACGSSSSDRWHDARAPWTGNGISADAAIRGLHSVTMTVRSLETTRRAHDGACSATRSWMKPRIARASRPAATAPGHSIDVVVDPDAGAAINGLGTVHHVAMAISNDDEQLRLREELVRFNLRLTDVRDRCYFNSIYFREPGGVLFEVATVSARLHDR